MVGQGPEVLKVKQVQTAKNQVAQVVQVQKVQTVLQVLQADPWGFQIAHSCGRPFKPSGSSAGLSEGVHIIIY